jgi:hypothetical protein
MKAKQYHSLPNGTRAVYLTDAPATRGEPDGLLIAGERGKVYRPVRGAA